MDTRICRICRIEKPLEAFSKNNKCKLGRVGTCKQCYNDRYRKIPLSPKGMQYCRKCNIRKKLEEFEKSASCTSGYKYRCKECRNKLYVKKGRAEYNAGWFKDGHPRIDGSGSFKKGIQNNPNGGFKKGHKPHSYIDGKTNERYSVVNTKRYGKLRLKVLARDLYRCQRCLKKSSTGNKNLQSLQK